MSLTYDSGATQAQRTRISSQIVEHLRAQTGRRMPYVQHVGQLAQPPLRTDGGGDELRRMWSGAHPSIWVVLGEARSDEWGTQIHQDLWQKQIDISIFVMTDHLRVGLDGRVDPDVVASADDRRDPGSRAIREQVEDLLMGWEMNEPDVGELEALGEELWLADNAAHIWRLRFQAPAWRTVKQGAEPAPRLQSLVWTEHGGARVRREMDMNHE